MEANTLRNIVGYIIYSKCSKDEEIEKEIKKIEEKINCESGELKKFMCGEIFYSFTLDLYKLCLVLNINKDSVLDLNLYGEERKREEDVRKSEKIKTLKKWLDEKEKGEEFTVYDAVKETKISSSTLIENTFLNLAKGNKLFKYYELECPHCGIILTKSLKTRKSKIKCYKCGYKFIPIFNENWNIKFTII